MPCGVIGCSNPHKTRVRIDGTGIVACCEECAKGQEVLDVDV